MTVSTNEAATCRWSSSAATSYSNMTHSFATTDGMAHSATVSSLANGQSYNRYVRCRDTAGNSNASSYALSFSVAAQSDTTPPVVSNGAPSGTLPAGTTSTTLSVTTNEAASCRWSSSASTAYGSMTNTFATTGGTSHSTTLTGLANGQSYSRYVRCADTAGNSNGSSLVVSFSIGAASDTTPPVLSNGAPSGTLPAGTTSTTLSVTTNEAATCKWGTTASTSYSSMTNTFATTGGTSHSTPLTGLVNGEVYNRYVRCRDASGNASTSSTLVSFSVGSTPSAGILWHDSLQTGSWPYGFDELLTDYPGDDDEDSCPPDDANGANLSRVDNPGPGGGYALRHFATFDEPGARSEAGLWSFDNEIFGAQAKSAEGIYVAQEWFFPTAMSAGGDDDAWINLWDWHSTGNGGANRWHTSPGLMLAEDGSMRVKWEWGGPAEAINSGTGLSSIALPVGEWVDVEMYYKWTTGRTTMYLWINGELALQMPNVQTRASSHTIVEMYSKWYGSTQGGHPWEPTPSVRYTRNLRISNARIWQD
jgi:hypothetical protein